MQDYIDRINAFRYMGCGGEMPENLLRLADKCETALREVMRPRHTYIVERSEVLDSILLGDDVRQHLSGCDNVIVFAATLGSAVDTLIRKYQTTDVTCAFITDAEASAAIESYCDDIEREISKMFPGKYLVRRFSPGYGDFPIDIQRDILSVLEAGKRIGLTVSDSFMMSPSKSVTAVMGISDAAVENTRNSCATCTMSDRCDFRKDGWRCGF